MFTTSEDNFKIILILYYLQVTDWVLADMHSCQTSLYKLTVIKQLPYLVDIAVSMQCLIERMTARTLQVHIEVIVLSGGLLCGAQAAQCVFPPCRITHVRQSKAGRSVCWLQYLARVTNGTAGRQQTCLSFGAWWAAATVTDLIVEPFIQHLLTNHTLLERHISYPDCRPTVIKAETNVLQS